MLGNIVSKKGMIIYLDKIRVIHDLEPQMNPSKVDSFVDYTRYYHKFVKVYTKLVYILEMILKKETPLVGPNNDKKDSKH